MQLKNISFRLAKQNCRKSQNLNRDIVGESRTQRLAYPMSLRDSNFKQFQLKKTFNSALFETVILEKSVFVIWKLKTILFVCLCSISHVLGTELISLSPLFCEQESTKKLKDKITICHT
jgi:hypothetical protein